MRKGRSAENSAAATAFVLFLIYCIYQFIINVAKLLYALFMMIWSILKLIALYADIIFDKIMRKLNK